MKAFFDGIARAFEAIGVHPVPGAFVVGVVIAFIFARRSSRDAASPGVHGPGSTSLPLGASFKANISHVDDLSFAVNGRTIDLPAEVMTLVRAGKKVEAIKALRAAAGIDLKTAKQLVDKLAASPAAH